MNFEIKNENFSLNGKKVFLNSGEIHYFRIKRDLWDTHLAAAKEAGLTTVSTYIPWAWHESEESVFDFEGASVPEKDLRGWLQRCQEHGLQCIVKPGPFILAEFRGAGLPDWFLDRYQKDVKMHDSHGGIVQSDGVTLINKDFLEKVALWYDKIMPFIREWQISAGGPVIMMQICNEIGVFSWLAHQADYSIGIRERFVAFISGKFRNIEQVNLLWGTRYSAFSDIELPPDGRDPYASKGDRGRDYEWHLFWRTYYGDYLKMLVEMARRKGITVPFYHNLPGWIYGNGYEFPVNITMYDDLFREKSEIIFGVDHIPEFFSYRNLHDDRIINDITRAMQGDKPLFAAEFQCGSREYHVVTNPKELELFYKASVANGLTGWNYYMFSQGRNPSRKGYSGDTFYWFTPLTPEGVRSSIYPLVKRMSKIIGVSEEIIVDAKRRAEICILFYPPYYATELEHPVNANGDLQFVASSIRRPAYFDGLLKVMQVMNIDYDMLDLSCSTPENLLQYKQVWAFSTDEMNEKDQQTLIDYTRSGGNCVLFPYLPDREMSQQPCTILRDALGINPSGREVIDSPLVDIFDLKDIKCANPQIIYSEASLHGAQVIARTIRGAACGFSKPLGEGLVIHLGTWLGFDTEGHKPVYERILQTSQAKLSQALSTSNEIIVRERFTNEGQALLFIGNYHNEDHLGKVYYTHPVSGESISIPYDTDEMLWPALYGILTPVNLKLTEGIAILHSTSDILGIKKVDENTLSLNLFGNRDLTGEILFEGASIHRIKSATIDGKALSTVFDGKRLKISYDHHHNADFKLTFILS